jgi:hypothetical protein
VSSKAGILPAMTNTVQHPELLAEIDRFLSETGMGASYFGKAATGNTEVVKRMRDGGFVSPRTEANLRRFMEQRQTKGDAA